MRRMAAITGGAVVILLMLHVARAAASSGEVLPAPAWDLLRSLPWPGALVATVFSPVGRALAGVITTWTAGRQSPPPAPPRGGSEIEEVAAALTDLAAAVRRSNEIQQQTVQALGQIQQGLAILLDRTSRGGGD